MLDTAANVNGKKTQLVDEIRDGFQDMEDYTKLTQLSHAVKHLERLLGSTQPNCSMCHQVEKGAANIAALESTGSKVIARIRELRPLAADATGREALDTLEHSLRDWIALYRQYLECADAGEFQAAHSIITDRMLPLRRNVDVAAAALAEQQRQFLAASSLEAHQQARFSSWSALGFVVFGMVVGAGVMLALRRTSREIDRITGELRAGAGQVSTSAGEVSGSSREAAEGACRQAETLREVAASSGEINTVAHSNAANARQTAELSAAFGQDLADADARLGQLLSAMRSIQKAGEKVVHIVRVIDGIAFQTNILSLNAAVEAARAGESGLGFAVVAGEVRSLAQRSADAARETAVLIEESIGAARNGMARVESVSSAFQSLTASARTVTELAETMRGGSEEQVRQVEMITERLGSIGQITERTAAGAEQGAAAGQVLATRAGDLRTIVGLLAAIVGNGEGDER
jgi:methyl-accepting chemotaxis protein